MEQKKEPRRRVLLKLFLSTLYLSAFTFGGGYVIVTLMKKQFVDTITRAKSFIEAYAEERLFDRDGVQGAKFSLINNFKGWREKPEDDGDGDFLARAKEILGGVDSVI